MKLHAYSFVLALPLSLASDALAQQQSFKIDPQSSEVAFMLGDVLHPVHGVFHVQSGAASKDILDVPHFAEISFVPRSVATLPFRSSRRRFTSTEQIAPCSPYVKWGLSYQGSIALSLFRVAYHR